MENWNGRHGEMDIRRLGQGDYVGLGAYRALPARRQRVRIGVC